MFSFDLKGSVVNRRDPVIQRGKALKCMNFVDLNSSKRKLVRLDTEQAEHILDTLDSDSRFLARMNMMDYSVLLDIEQVTAKTDMSRLHSLNRNEFVSYDSKNIYHIGLIDFLEPYSIFKKAETAFKTRVMMGKMAQISCVPPDYYQERLMRFVKKQMLGPHLQDSRKIKLCESVLDLTYFKRLEKLHQSNGNLAEVMNFGSDEEQQTNDRLRLNGTIVDEHDGDKVVEETLSHIEEENDESEKE